jgi:ribonuclease P protein component
MVQRAPKAYRLTRRKDIDRVFDAGARANDRHLTLVAAPNELGYARVGVGVSTRHGTAVRRNRVKRLCREAFRLVRDELPGGFDYMLVPRPGREFTVAGLQESLRTLAPRVCQGKGAD